VVPIELANAARGTCARCPVGSTSKLRTTSLSPTTAMASLGVRESILSVKSAHGG
jgi:hypothetical protein